MLNVGKIQNNNYIRANTLSGATLSSFGNNIFAQEAYLEMNKDVYVDFVEGDISVLQFLANKLKNFWNIATNKDPMIEIKARIIEENLKNNARENMEFSAIA